MNNLDDPPTSPPKHNNPAQAPNPQALTAASPGVKTKQNPNNSTDMSLNLPTGGSKTDPLKQSKNRVVSVQVGKGKDWGDGGRGSGDGQEKKDKGRVSRGYAGNIQGLINRDRRCYSNHRSNYEYVYTSRPNPPINQYKNTHTYRQKTLNQSQNHHQRSQTQQSQKMSQRPKQKQQQTQKQAQKQKRQALALRQSRQLETRYLIEEKFRRSKGREYRIEYEGDSKRLERYGDRQDDGVLDTYRLSSRRQERQNTARTGIPHINNRIRYRKLLQTEPQASNPQLSRQKSLNQYKNPIFNTATSPQKGPNSGTSRTATRKIEYPVSGSHHRGHKNLEVVNVRDISVGSSQDQEYQLLKGLDVVDLRAYHDYLGDCVYSNHGYHHKQRLTKEQIIKKYQIIPTWHRSLTLSINKNNNKSKPKTKQLKQKQWQNKSQERTKFTKLQLQQEEECIDQSLNRQIERQIQLEREKIKSVNRGAKANGRQQASKGRHVGVSKEKQTVWTKRKLDNIHITDAINSTKSKIASTGRNQAGTNTKLNILERYKKSLHRINTIAACNQLSVGSHRQKNQDISIKQKQLQTQLYDNEGRQCHTNLATVVETNTNHTISLYHNQVLESKIQRILSNSRVYLDNQKQRQSLKRMKKLKSKSKSKQKSKQKLGRQENTPHGKYDRKEQKYFNSNSVNRNPDSNNISISRYADSANKQQISPSKYYQIIKQSKLSQFHYMPKSQSVQRQQSPYRSKALLQKQRQSQAKKITKTQQIQALSPIKLHPKRKKIKTQTKSNHTLPANYSGKLDKSQSINSYRYQPNDPNKQPNTLQQNTQREKYIQKIQNIISKSMFKKQSKSKNAGGNNSNGAQGVNVETSNGYLINKYKF